MSQQNEFFTNEFTSVLDKLVREVVNDPATYKGAELLPSVAKPVRTIRTEVIESSGGLTNQHLPGTQPQYIQSFGTRVTQFSPPAYKEKILYDEDKILYLRELGQNDPSKRGIRQYITEDINRLNRRMEARIEYERWQTIFNGGFSWMGKTFSYGVPTQNNVVPLGQNWSTDGLNANAGANPIVDYRYWTQGGYAPFRKYKIKKCIMSANTARWFLDNANTRSYIQNALANQTFNSYDINAVIGFFIPGAPPVEIYDGWYQTESLSTDTNTPSRIITSDAIYFIPDGKLFFECHLPDGDKIGEFTQGLNLASGSVDQPGFGKFLVVEENIAPGTKGGPGNPYIDIIGGVYGGVNMRRPFDILTGTVYTAS